MRQLAQLEKKSKEDNFRERLYQFGDKPEIINHLINTVPNFNQLLVSLDSGMVYDCLTEYAKKLKSKKELIQVFLLLDDPHRCALLKKYLHNKTLFLALIEKAPPSTKEELRKSAEPALLQLAQNFLDAWFFNKAFYSVYEILSDEQQIICLKRVLQEPSFRPKRFEMINEMKAALRHPIEFIEYVLGKAEKTAYRGIVNPSFLTETTQFFDKIIPTLPSLHIVTLFWRIARTNLQVWGTRQGWVFEFQGTQEEKEFFKSLSFEQVTRLSKTKQPWVALWHPSEQPDEKIIESCFHHLERAGEIVTEYKDTVYNQTGRLFKKNWDDFLELLSLPQISMLICKDPQLQDLNQIFGFNRKIATGVPENLLQPLQYSQHTRFAHCISIPAILQYWWEMSLKEMDAQERLEAIQALQIEKKYTDYLIFMHTQYEQSLPYVESAMRDHKKRMDEARALYQDWSSLHKTWNEFLFEKHQARMQAEQAQQNRKRVQEEQERLYAENLAIIKNALRNLGLNSQCEHSRNEIEKSVRKELFKYHPDRQTDQSVERYTMITNARDNIMEALSNMRLDKTPIC